MRNSHSHGSLPSSPCSRIFELPRRPTQILSNTQKLFASSLEFNSIWWTKTSIWYFLIFSEFLLQQYIFYHETMFLSNFLETEAQKRHYKLWNKIIVVGPPHKPRFGAISVLIWVMVQIAPILKSANCSTSLWRFQEITISALSPLN